MGHVTICVWGSVPHAHPGSVAGFALGVGKQGRVGNSGAIPNMSGMLLSCWAPSQAWPRRLHLSGGGNGAPAMLGTTWPLGSPRVGGPEPPTPTANPSEPPEEPARAQPAPSSHQRVPCVRGPKAHAAVASCTPAHAARRHRLRPTSSLADLMFHSGGGLPGLTPLSGPGLWGTGR